MQLTIGKRDWTLDAVTAFLSTEDDTTPQGVDLEGSTKEFRMGFQKTWSHDDKLRTYLGAGLAHISAELEASNSIRTARDDDAALGYWVNAGLVCALNNSFNLGAYVG